MAIFGSLSENFNNAHFLHKINVFEMKFSSKNSGDGPFPGKALPGIFKFNEEVQVEALKFLKS